MVSFKKYNIWGLGRGSFPSPLYTDHKFRLESIEPNHLKQPHVAIISIVVQQNNEHEREIVDVQIL
jgi:hypothetical protein